MSPWTRAPKGEREFSFRGREKEMERKREGEKKRRRERERKRVGEKERRGRERILQRKGENFACGFCFQMALLSSSSQTIY